MAHPCIRPGEDEATYWARRLPLNIIFVGKSKGRTIYALAKAIEGFSKSEGMMNDANLLRKYEAKCKLAAKFRQQSLPTLDYSEARASRTPSSSWPSTPSPTTARCPTRTTLR